MSRFVEGIGKPETSKSVEGAGISPEIERCEQACPPPSETAQGKEKTVHSLEQSRGKLIHQNGQLEAKNQVLLQKLQSVLWTSDQVKTSRVGTV